MNFRKQLFTLALAAGVFLVFSSQAEAHKGFKDYISKKFPEKKVSCVACHVDKQPKTVRNNLGKLFTKHFESKTMSADLKGKKGEEKKKFQTEVLMPAFEKAYKKIEGMTMKDLAEAGVFGGIETPEE